MASRFDATWTRGLVEFRKAGVTYEKPTFTFLTKYLFGGQGVRTEEDYIATKYRKKEHKLIPDTRRGDNAKRLSRDFSYKREIYETPYFFYEDGIGRDDRKTLCFGEDPNNRRSYRERLLYKLSEKTDSIRRDLDLIPEKYCADILLTGKIVPTVQETGDIVFLRADDVNFPLADNISSEETKWDSTGFDIYKRIGELVKAQFRRTGTMPDTMIVPLDVFDLMMTDEKIKEALDNRSIDIGKIEPLKITAEGYAEMGLLKFPGAWLRIITYMGFYNDEDGKQQNFLPDDKIILTNGNIGSVNYGGLETIGAQGEPIPIAGEELITVHTNDDIPATKTVKIQRAPLPIPEVLNGWKTVTVL